LRDRESGVIALVVREQGVFSTESTNKSRGKFGFGLRIEREYQELQEDVQELAATAVFL
jgi:hypothetical protein